MQTFRALQYMPENSSLVTETTQIPGDSECYIEEGRQKEKWQAPINLLRQLLHAPQTHILRQWGLLGYIWLPGKEKYKSKKQGYV